MNLEIVPQAQQDIAKAAKYYQDRRAGLELDFLSKVDAAVATIASFLERVPYGIYYRLPDADTVRVIIVRHRSRRPGFGMRRK